MNFNEILYGVAYYDEYMPYDRIETDFKMIRDAGMNVIRIAESTWSTWEPKEGVFDFTHLHRMLDCAAKYKLKVIVGTPTYAIPISSKNTREMTSSSLTISTLNGTITLTACSRRSINTRLPSVWISQAAIYITLPRAV